MLIGLAAIGLLWANGRIAGINGIIAGVLHPSKGNALGRVLFIASLLVGAFLIRWLHPDAMAVRIDVSDAAVLLGGFLVGIGTRIGNGCTSGHGVCGVGRLAPRSLVAEQVGARDVSHQQRSARKQHKRFSAAGVIPHQQADMLGGVPRRVYYFEFDLAYR
jgi:hypothetical protein